MVNTEPMKQWFYILLLCFAFVANSSAAMLMPIQMLPALPVSGDSTSQAATAKTTGKMPCHQAAEADSEAKPSGTHCSGCMNMGHTTVGDGCGSCSCFSVGGVLSVAVELTPLVLPAPEYTAHYLLRFSSVPPLPLLRPPQTV